jgi:heterodisulfide reductase subunit B2
MAANGKRMKFALFLGCNIPARLTPYESSARAVLGRLGVELADIQEFNCCGYPIRNVDFKAFLLSAGRNLALAARKNLNVLSLCKCCFGSLKKAAHVLREDAALREEINRALGKEGLRYDERTEVKHLLSVLFHDVGVEAIQQKITTPPAGLKIAVQYGCHALRPSQVVEFDDPAAPTLFDRLVEATGAKSIDWPLKLECCGAPLLGINDDLSMDLTRRKLSDGRKSGADCICTACTYCQLQFDTVQKKIVASQAPDQSLPILLFPQILGLSMGLDRESLGLTEEGFPGGGMDRFWKPEREGAQASPNL